MIINSTDGAVAEIEKTQFITESATALLKNDRKNKRREKFGSLETLIIAPSKEISVTPRMSHYYAFAMIGAARAYSISENYPMLMTLGGWLAGSLIYVEFAKTIAKYKARSSYSSD